MGGAFQANVALADAGPLPGAFGYDISYPQCPSRVPEGPVGFGIIGVNGGKPLTENSCMPAQLAWARGGTVAPAVYVNTSSPPATFTTNPCATTDANCRGFEFGRASARYSLAYVALHDPSVTRYWLDVETANTWSSDVIANAAVLRGMVDVLTAAGKYVGIYSNNYQFTRIAGNYSPGLDNWIPRPEAKRETVANYCRTTPSFGGGRVAIIQMWYTFDENYVCPLVLGPPPPPATSFKAGDSAVVAADGTCLNLRAGAGVTFPIVKCLAEGTKVSVSGSPVVSGQFHWVPVSALGGSGWVAADYLQLAAAAPPAPPPAPTPAPKPAQYRIVVGNLSGG